MSHQPTIVVGSYLEPDLVAPHPAARPPARVIYEPDLLRCPATSAITPGARALSDTDLDPLAVADRPGGRLVRLRLARPGLAGHAVSARAALGPATSAASAGS